MKDFLLFQLSFDQLRRLRRRASHRAKIAIAIAIKIVLLTRNLARSIRLGKLPSQSENQEKINPGKEMTGQMSKKRHSGVGGLKQN